MCTLIITHRPAMLQLILANVHCYAAYDWFKYARSMPA